MTPQCDLLAAEFSSGRGWTRRDATHLLWRAQHGASAEEIESAFASGPEMAVERLLTEQEETPGFRSADAALGRLAEDSGNIDDWKAWWAHRLAASSNPLVEKMTLLWHNHFATSNAKVRSAEHMAAQNGLFRRHAVGSFRELVHAIARDVAMLVWLDGNANRRRQPNENFARELMELFCLGPGNYTEKDIQEAARAFTGWHVRDGKFWFNRGQHDTGVKTVFGESGDFDGDDVIELCLAEPAAARFLAGKLLRALVTSAPDEMAIEALAACIRSHDFRMTPVLRQLLTSRLFYAALARRALVKSPAELVLGAVRSLGGQPNLAECVRQMAELGQNLFEPPTVEGWVGGRLWINSATMLGRANFAAELATGERFGTIASPAEAAVEHGWSEPGEAIGYYAELLLADDVSAARGIIERHVQEMPGSLDERLRAGIHLLMVMPEFQLV